MRRHLINAVVAAVMTLCAGNVRADMADDLKTCPDLENPQLAQEACTRVIAAAQMPPSQLAVAYLYRGHALRTLGEHTRALADFESAVELDPVNAAAHHNRGYELGELGRREEAVEAYTRALALSPSDAVALASRGATYINLNQFEKAAADYTAAIAQDPDDVSNYVNRARVPRFGRGGQRVGRPRHGGSVRATKHDRASRQRLHAPQPLAVAGGC